jgi:hypothetical protein
MQGAAHQPAEQNESARIKARDFSAEAEPSAWRAGFQAEAVQSRRDQGCWRGCGDSGRQSVEMVRAGRIGSGAPFDHFPPRAGGLGAKGGGDLRVGRLRCERHLILQCWTGGR